MQQSEEIWQAVLGELQLQMTRATFDTWVRDTRLVAYEDGTFIVGVPNPFAKDWLDNRLRPVVKRALTHIVGRSVDLQFIIRPREVRDSFRREENPLLEQVAVEDESLPRSANRLNHDGLTLNPRYTFDTFIVGPSNRMAHAAAQSVAERPGRTYNPLFLYGGVGLGKTHLLHAIAHAARRRDFQALYVSSEQFTIDLINAIRTHSTEAFREKYRTLDILLIDDIQFIGGRESTQEEFFHTFNVLHGANRHIVVSSDRPPQAIATLEERLRSRFRGGLCIDIQPPDLETRVAILQAKASERGAVLPYEMLDLIARRIRTNVRELEGALNRVLAHVELMGHIPSLEQVEEILHDVAPRTSQLPPEAFVELVAGYYGLTPEDLRGRSRKQTVVHPRQIAMYLLREEAGLSLPQIAAALGKRDHTTALHSIEKIETQLQVNDMLRREVMELR
ncbi:MAG TPA: chromosomal replication initiator protein DnaA, partial [Anaerolineae bacterium]|nr:chromosomal replication initiator protein DnaA [Anaerolineae bacterium]HIQ04441.1 chromosomal replication initiator protein DnaA [Anaerolineae bacterium]